MIDLTDHSFEHVLKSYLVLIDLLCVLVVFHILCLLYISLRSLLEDQSSNSIYPYINMYFSLIYSSS